MYNTKFLRQNNELTNILTAPLFYRKGLMRLNPEIWSNLKEKS
jgi:hypothetical protein